MKSQHPELRWDFIPAYVSPLSNIRINKRPSFALASVAMILVIKRHRLNNASSLPQGERQSEGASRYANVFCSTLTPALSLRERG